MELRRDQRPGRQGAHPRRRRARGAAPVLAARQPEYLRAIEPIGTDAVKPHITDAPYLIIVFEQLWGLGADGSKHKHYYVRESVGIAVGLLITALHTARRATLTHAPSPMGFLKEILGRPENERPFLLLPVGYPAEGASVPALDKKPLEAIATFVS